MIQRNLFPAICVAIISTWTLGYSWEIKTFDLCLTKVEGYTKPNHVTIKLGNKKFGGSSLNITYTPGETTLPLCHAISSEFSFFAFEASIDGDYNPTTSTFKLPPDGVERSCINLLEQEDERIEDCNFTTTHQIGSKFTLSWELTRSK